MFHECDDCNISVDPDADSFVEDEAGLHCQSCHEAYTAKSMAEAGIPPHAYRVNVAYENEAYDRSNYKHSEWLEDIL